MQEAIGCQYEKVGRCEIAEDSGKVQTGKHKYCKT
jgi:hypothetical protein